ncbi:MAG TPA: type II secretion system F family protein [Solirubrobacteraceae bacterium]|nr:type II secretion system F family protein [Solirubrobacteraceae bacterium]
MTRATVLAALAGLIAAAAVVEIASLLAAGQRAHRPAPSGKERANRDATAPGRSGAALQRLVAVVARLGRRLGAPTAPRDLPARLAAAGQPLGLGPADAMALKGVGALAGLLGGVWLGTALPGRLGLAVVAGAPVAGFLALDVWLARRARRRGEGMARELPDVLDLLRVAVEAGLAVPRALEEVARRRPGELAGELLRAAERSNLGVPRARVLQELVTRCPAPGIDAFTTAIARAERHGAPLAPALAAQAAEARAARSRRLHEAAARAAPKIQLVVALVLVPAVMLIMAAGLIQALAPGL